MFQDSPQRSQPLPESCSTQWHSCKIRRGARRRSATGETFNAFAVASFCISSCMLQIPSFPSRSAIFCILRLAGRWGQRAGAQQGDGSMGRAASPDPGQAVGLLAGRFRLVGGRSVHAPFRLFCVGGAQPGRKGDGAVLPRICPGIPLYKRRHKVKTSQSRVSGWTRGSDVLIYGILIYIVIYGRRKSFCPCGAGGRAMHNAEAALQLLRRCGSVVEGFVHLRSTDLVEPVRSGAANRTGVIRRQFSALVHIATDLAAPLRGGRCRLLLRRDRCAG